MGCEKRLGGGTEILMLQTILSTIIFIGSFAFVLGLVVFIHEMGHYSVARLFGVAVDRFSIGFGKPIYKRTAKSGTQWVVGRIPLGGYVKFMGDAGAASNPDTERLKKIKAEIDTKHGAQAWKTCLHFKPLYQRFLVVLAGPVANFVLAAVIFAGLAFFVGDDKYVPKITSVTPGSAAQQAGFRAGDEFVSINGRAVDDTRAVAQMIELRSGSELSVIVKRDGGLETLYVKPVRTEKIDGVGGKYKAGQIGVGFKGPATHITYGPMEASIVGVKKVQSSLSDTGYYIGRIFQGKEDGKALGSIVKIGAITGKVGVMASQVEGGFGEKLRVMWLSLISIAAGLSIGLGFANLMPIPVLDGGHLMYYLYEAVMRKPLSEGAQEIGFRVGFAVLITLFLYLTWNDVGYVSGMFNKTG